LAQHLTTFKHGAERLGIKEPTLRLWAAEQRIAVVRLGRLVRIPVEEIDRLIAEGTVPARRAR
jgi:excisionase family DNA binding protein